jgi:hypothetical protein
MVFCVATLCNDVVGYQCSRGPCCLHLHFTLKMEAEWSSETLASYHITIRRRNTLAWGWRQCGVVSLKMEAGRTSETLIYYHINTRRRSNTPWRWRQRGPPNRRYPTTLHGIATLHPEDGFSMILRNVDNTTTSIHGITKIHPEDGCIKITRNLISYHITTWRHNNSPSRWM